MIEINKNPSRSELRWFGLLFGVFLSLVAAVVWWRFEALRAAKVMWAIAAAAAAVYYVIPPLRRWMFFGWLYLTYPIGWTVSHVILGLTWYLVVTPIGLAMRLAGRDPMQRRLDPDAATYWQPRRQAPDTARYFKQF